MSESPESGTLSVDVEHGRLELQGEDRTVHASVRVETHGALDDAQAWVAAIDEIAASERSGASLVSSVVVRASEIGLVCTDADGVILHPVLWAHDERSAPDAAWCRKKHADAWWRSEVGVVPEHRHLVTKLSWLHRSAPDVWERAQHFCSLEDYLRRVLVSTGASGSIVTRPSVAGAFGLWGDGRYHTEVLALIDAERNWSGVLPEVADEGTALGSWHQVEVRL